MLRSAGRDVALPQCFQMNRRLQMKTNRKFLKVLQRKIHIALVMGIVLALVGPAHAAPASLAGPAQEIEAPALLQFTSSGHALGFTPQGMYAATGSHALHVDFVNANNVQPQADSSVSPSASLTDDKTAPLRRVAYVDLWAGINLAYTASAGSIYNTAYTLAPRADAKNIRLRYNAPVHVDEAGNLRIAFETGEMIESAPIAWQEIDGQRVAVQIAFRLLDPPIQNSKSKIQNPMVTFALGTYDPRYALTFNPSLTWNTFLGGSANDDGRAIAVDGSGNVFVAGNSYATWGSPVRIYKGDRDGFAAKLDSSGNLLWNTFLGGSGFDGANGIALDGSGNVWIVGDSSAAWTCLDLFLCTRQAYKGGIDAFMAQLDPSGHLDLNAFLGGDYTDYGTAIAVDTISNPNVIWVAGDYTTLWNFVYDFDAFTAKLDLDANVVANNNLGARYQDEFANGIAVDRSGNVYVAGDSDKTWGFPIRPHDSGVNPDAFAAKLDSSNNLLWNTFLGGSGTDYGYGIAMDGSNVYVTGESAAAWGSPVHAHADGTDFFAAKLDSSGNLLWNTFLGGSGNDSGHGIAVKGGNIYMAGFVWYDFTLTPNNDAIVYQLDLSGELTAAYRMGGNGNGYDDYGNGIAIRGRDVYVAGAGADTWGNPVHPYYGSGVDAFIAKMNFPSRTYLPLVLKNF
jgi:hypothetical protein